MNIQNLIENLSANQKPLDIAWELMKAQTIPLLFLIFTPLILLLIIGIIMPSENRGKMIGTNGFWVIITFTALFLFVGLGIYYFTLAISID